MEVEFEAITDDNGKLKAQNVTTADGSACPGPEPRERRKRQPKKKEAESGEEEDGDGEKVDGGEKAGDGGDGTGAEKKGKNNRRRRKNSKNGKQGEPAPGSWYAELEETVQKSMESRNIKIDGGRAFLPIGDALSLTPI